MTALALTNAFIYVHSHDFTGDANELQLPMEAVELDKTTFRSQGWKELAGGLKKVMPQAKGLFAAGTDSPDAAAFADLGVASRVWTVGPDESTEGDVAYMFKAGQFSYAALEGNVGDLAGFTISGAGSDGVGVVRGRLLKKKGTVSATGALGTAVQLGAVSSDQKVYATLHLFGTAGSSITVLVESDDADTFSSATTQMTIGSLTAAGGTWQTPVAGAITDDWWRFRVSAISGSWSIAAALAIQ
jgi:hypothetical protein